MRAANVPEQHQSKSSLAYEETGMKTLQYNEHQHSHLFLVPVYDGTILGSVIIDDDGFDPTSLPSYHGEITADTVALVGYTINRYSKDEEGKGKAKENPDSPSIRISYNLLFIVVLAPASVLPKDT